MMIPEVITPTLSIVTRSSSSWTTLASRFPVHRIYCIGRNYREHALEMGGNPDRDPPFFFQKPASAIVDTNTMTGGIPYPPMTSNLHYEGELVVAIGGAGLNMTEDQAEECIYGYAVGCDLTRRDLQAQAKKQVEAVGYRQGV